MTDQPLDSASRSEHPTPQELDRRTFMGTTGGLLAALASGGLAAHSAKAHGAGVHNSVDDVIRVGLVGCGGQIGRAHV